jgi:hypothetical protein
VVQWLGGYPGFAENMHLHIGRVYNVPTGSRVG